MELKQAQAKKKLKKKLKKKYDKLRAATERVWHDKIEPLSPPPLYLEDNVKQALLDVVESERLHLVTGLDGLIWEAGAYEILSSKANLEYNVKQALLDLIKTDPLYAHKYARNVIRGRWKEAEEYIKTAPVYAYWYAVEIIKGRFPEAEEYIKTDPQCAFYYAEQVIKGRFPEAEPYIKTDPEWACAYVTDVIKERWIGAEDAIKKKKKGVGNLVIRYCSAINQPIPELEPFLTFKQKVKYCHRFGIKLQEEFHNEMLAKAIVDDKTAKKYMENIAVIDKLNELSKEEIVEKIIRNELQENVVYGKGVNYQGKFRR